MDKLYQPNGSIYHVHDGQRIKEIIERESSLHAWSAWVNDSRPFRKIVFS